MNNGTTSGRLSCAACGGIVVTTPRGFDCPRCSGPEWERRVREIAAALVENGMSTSRGASRWTVEQSETADIQRRELTAELVALVLEGRA